MTYIRSGTLVYTGRAARQDAALAMQGDIVAALIELITNADDAYREVQQSGLISVEIDRGSSPFKFRVTVRDQAIGLRFEDLLKKFTELGNENDGSAGDLETQNGSRGLFGRGAKDVSWFGLARFEAVRDGYYSALEINSDAQFGILAEDEVVSDELRDRMNLPGDKNGLTATIFVAHRRATGFPTTSKLTEQLSRHVALREIIQRQRVMLTDNRTNSTSLLRFDPPESVPLFDEYLPISDYDMTVRLVLRRFLERQDGRLDEYSYQGLVVRDLRANYENTFFGLTSRPEAGWFSGEIVAPEIDVLTREIDKIEIDLLSADTTGTQANPIRLVKRTRDGLERRHPYYRALYQLVDERCRPFFDAIANEEEANKSEGRNLRERLDLVSRSLTDLLRQVLEEAEAGQLPEGGSGSDFSSIAIIPPTKYVVKGQNASLMLRAPIEDFDAYKARVELLDSTGAFSLIGGAGELEWEPHPRLPLMKATLKVHAHEYGATEVIFKYGDKAVTGKVICAFSPESPFPDPEGLEWDKDFYSVSPTRSRSLLLLAPATDAGESISLTCGLEGLTFPEKVVLSLDKSGTHCFAVVKCRASAEIGEGDIAASFEGGDATTAICVRDANPNKGPELKIEIKNQDAPNRSTLILAGDVLRVEIYALHKAIRPVLGPHTGDQYLNSDSPVWHATLVEIVSSQLANYALERESAMYPNRYRDASSLFQNQQEKITKFVSLMQTVLLEEHVESGQRR
jgi:anti-sigma regulatory factor (Ser/Thr protein kinase)